MSEIAEALNYIDKRLAELTPERAEAMQPGLSLEAIERLTASLPFKLPSLVCALYNWHDGVEGGLLFGGYEFLSLEAAVNSYYSEVLQLEADAPEVAELFRDRFPVFELSHVSHVFVTVAPNEKGESPVYGHDTEGKHYSLLYDSFNNLILHLAKWYEQAVFLEEDECWEISDPAVSARLEVKYMAREHIIELARGCGAIEETVYQQFLDTGIVSI